MATQHNVKLIGMKSKTEVARIGSEVIGFIDADKKFAIWNITEKSIKLNTAKGSYEIAKAMVANRYEGTCGKIRVHVVLKKVSGKIIYWTK